jgi:ribosomal protein S18 acetylase RimI-like enzyme
VVADAAALAHLVNRAYAVEEFFVAGDRTDAAEIAQMMTTGTFLVLDRVPETGNEQGLAAAVYVTVTGEQGPVRGPSAVGTGPSLLRSGQPAIDSASGYFGMLAVGPGLQGQGIGKRMVRIAEALAEAAGCTRMTMKIVNLREELGRWYRSLGYREVGTTPYVVHRPVKRSCHFVDMARSLGEPAVLAA